MQPRKRRPLFYDTVEAKVSQKDLDLALGLLYQIGLGSSEVQKSRGRPLLRVQVPAGISGNVLKQKLRAWERGPLGTPLFHDLKLRRRRRGAWADRYQKHLKPFRLLPAQPQYSRMGIWIDPRGKIPARRREDTLYIGAGLAFGTGTHPTTRLAALALADSLVSIPKAPVLDIGCGTGILAMVATRLGAGRIVAVDNDPQALAVAKENLKHNGIRKVSLHRDLQSVRGRFSLIVGNIGLVALSELRPALEAKLAPGGRLILTGLLYRDAAPLRKAYRGYRLLERRNRKGWTLLVLEQRQKK